MGLTLEAGVPAVTVFLQGLISFFSPCVLPLLPLYIGYLAGGAKTVGEDGTISYKQGKVMFNTLFFVLGISFAFFSLGLGFTAAGRFFSGNQMLFARIGGMLVIFFGLYQLGLFGSLRTMGQEHRLPIRLDRMAMNPVTALILGFAFSFAWTPCVGPALASVLLMAASASSAASGFLLVGVYTLGFVIPFLAAGLFTGALLDFFKKYRGVVRYTVKAGGALMVFMGVMMFTGWMNSVTGYLSSITQPPGSGREIAGGPSLPEDARASKEKADVSTVAEPPAGEREANPSAGEPGPAAGEEKGTDSSKPEIPAVAFTLTDQYGDTHSMSDFEGKVVFLNFWTTWCGYCKQEMPHIEELYQEYGRNEGDVVILGVAAPKSSEFPNNMDSANEAEVKAFLEDNGYTFPVVMDTTGDLFNQYGVYSFPTTFMIGADGNVFGYIPGAMTKEVMKDIIRQTLEASGMDGR